MSDLTPKQEKFCQKYIELGNASEAYRQAYDAENMAPETINSEAPRLLQNPHVTTRVAELGAEHMERHRVTVDSITEELEEARSLAIQTEQPSAAVSASMGKAKIHGLLIDKTELTGKDGKPIEISDAKAALLRGLVPNATGGGADPKDQ